VCEAAAYIVKDGKEELVLESVDVLENENGEVSMVNLFGEQKRIKTLSLVEHKIVLEQLG